MGKIEESKMKGDSMQPIFLNPSLQEKIWGGDQLHTTFGLEIPSDRTGEAWLISAHPHGLSTVTQPEAYQGMTLDELYDQKPELFGPDHPEPFPLLVKVIDAKEALSVQVHPDDAYAREHEGPQELGKTECWYVLSAQEDASIIYGHQATCAEEFRQALEEERFDQVFREVPVQAGDFFDVPAGTIHAIGAGITILEIQQSSDTTYRVYDYGRVDDQGNPRELHLQQSLDVTHFPHEDSPYSRSIQDQAPNSAEELLTNPFFSVQKVDVDQSLTLDLTGPYTLGVVIDGKGQLEVAGNHYDLDLITSFVLPHGIDSVTITGQCSLLLTHPC